MHIINVILLCFLLSSCQQNVTFDNLMRNPILLQKKIAECDIVESANCAMVADAARKFSDLVEEQNHDPQAFGLKTMQMQQELVRLSMAYETAKKTKDITQIKMAKEAYQDQYQRLQYLYAVLALRGPE